MDAVWNLYRFDYDHFVQIRPLLRSASDPAAFSALDDGPETEAIIEALIEGDVDVVGARQDFLISHCCVGEPLPCPRRFPRILQQMRIDVRTEEGTEILSDAIVGARNLETWLRPPGKITGLLTPEETSAVRAAYWAADDARRPRRAKTKPKRRGGLLSAIATFFRRLFDRGLASDEVYRLLGQLLEEAVENGQGIAVISV